MMHQVRGGDRRVASTSDDILSCTIQIVSQLGVIVGACLAENERGAGALAAV